MRTGRFNLDYWRQTSDRWRVEFETTRRPLPAPEQLEDMRNQVTDLCADRDYWRQTCDHWRVAFETAQRLLPAPVERGTTAVTSWRGVFGQLCSTWAAQLARALSLVPHVVMLLRLVSLEGQGRSDILDAGALARVYPFRNRLQIHRDGWPGPHNSNPLALAWFVWAREHNGPPTPHRISWSTAEPPPAPDAEASE
jgi:hypothetical protein